MIANGHPDAPDYPVALVWEENQLVVERTNRLLTTEAALLQSAASTAVAAFAKDGGAAAYKSFKQLLERLSGDEEDEVGPEPLKRMSDPVNKGAGRGK